MKKPPKVFSTFEGGDAMSTYEAISIMIMFAMLIIAIDDKKSKK